MVGTYNPQGFVVVVAVNDEASLELGERMLHFINMLEVSEKTVILVANKADLVRTRVVKPIGNKNVMFIFTFPNIVKSFPFIILCITSVLSSQLFSILVAKELARKFNVKYLETSTGRNISQSQMYQNIFKGINHNLDELLVELTLQMKQKRLERFKRRRSSIRMVGQFYFQTLL